MCRRHLSPVIYIVIAVVAFSSGNASKTLADPPYPKSKVITGVTFDFSTLRKLAPGSDNWPITWADDGHQYTCWGDGGGFGGTNREGRVSLGFARVEGRADDYKGTNLWGGFRGQNQATFGGKSYGIEFHFLAADFVASFLSLSGRTMWSGTFSTEHLL